MIVVVAKVDFNGVVLSKMRLSVLVMVNWDLDWRRLFATRVVLMQSFDGGIPVSLSLMMLTLSFSL